MNIWDKWLEKTIKIFPSFDLFIGVYRKTVHRTFISIVFKEYFGSEMIFL